METILTFPCDRRTVTGYEGPLTIKVSVGSDGGAKATEIGLECCPCCLIEHHAHAITGAALALGATHMVWEGIWENWEETDRAKWRNCSISHKSLG